MNQYNIFTIEDIINNKNYLFVGNFNEIDDIINKVNNKGVNSLTNSDKKLIDKYFDSKRINKNTILVKALINMEDTIDIIKKKIMVYLKKPPNNLYLWIRLKKLRSKH